MNQQETGGEREREREARHTRVQTPTHDTQKHTRTHTHTETHRHRHRHRQTHTLTWSSWSRLAWASSWVATSSAKSGSISETMAVNICFKPADVLGFGELILSK